MLAFDIALKNPEDATLLEARWDAWAAKCVGARNETGCRNWSSA